jgi:transcriptional regulator with XRE-family HTH domain
MLKHLKDFKNFSLFESIRIEKMDPSTYKKETVTTLPYVNKIEENRQLFLKKLCKIAEDLDIKPEWLLHTIFHESRFDSKYKDQMSRAVGLISFLPSILKIFINDDW